VSQEEARARNQRSLMELMARYNRQPEGTPYCFTHTSGTHFVRLDLNRNDFLRYSDLDNAIIGASLGCH
jgi:hypothetical protein